jgi:hypothetical protein
MVALQETNMKKLAFLATAAGLFLISNAPPPGPGPDDPRDYPPCSATVTDDCIQRERGEPESRALDAMPADEDSGARGGPYEPPPVAAEAPRVYPPCSATVTDSCQQGARTYARRSHARPVRYARRVRHAGERG